MTYTDIRGGSKSTAAHEPPCPRFTMPWQLTYSSLTASRRYVFWKEINKESSRFFSTSIRKYFSEKRIWQNICTSVERPQVLCRQPVLYEQRREANENEEAFSFYFISTIKRSSSKPSPKQCLSALWNQKTSELGWRILQVLHDVPIHLVHKSHPNPFIWVRFTRRRGSLLFTVSLGWRPATPPLPKFHSTGSIKKKVMKPTVNSNKVDV